MIYVVCYDITDDQRRRRVFKELHNYGTRIQYSVFECDLEAKKSSELVERLTGLINTDEDMIRVYRLCGDCRTASTIIGHGRISVDQDFYIV